MKVGGGRIMVARRGKRDRGEREGAMERERERDDAILALHLNTALTILLYR